MKPVFSHAALAAMRLTILLAGQAPAAAGVLEVRPGRGSAS